MGFANAQPLETAIASLTLHAPAHQPWPWLIIARSSTEHQRSTPELTQEP